MESKPGEVSWDDIVEGLEFQASLSTLEILKDSKQKSGVTGLCSMKSKSLDSSQDASAAV